MVTSDAAEESDVSLELSSKTETVQSFSTNYVLESGEGVDLFIVSGFKGLVLPSFLKKGVS